jgi:hypothetical protein
MARCVMNFKSNDGWKKCPEDANKKDADEQVGRNLKSAQSHENVSSFYSSGRAHPATRPLLAGASLLKTFPILLKS